MVLATENHNLQICIEVDKDNQIIKRDPEVPTLYVDYPLIGSHSFPHPCVINSHIFLPDEERSSIVLEHSALSSLNKAILMRVTTLYSTLIMYLCN